jgi:hypothetical protein
MTAKELFQTGCALIAAPYADCGFKYARSGPHLERKSGDWTFHIAFLRSRTSNPEHAALWISGRVLSKRVKAWRAAQARPALRSDDHVGGGQIGNLRDDKGWLEWTLTAPDGPPDVVRSAQGAIDSLALPFFALFEDPDCYAEALAKGALPEVSIGVAVELLVAENRKDAAVALGRGFLAESPDRAPACRKILDEIRKSGKLPIAHSGHVAELAHATYAYDLGLG